MDGLTGAEPVFDRPERVVGQLRRTPPRRQAAFGHHLDQVSEAEFEAQVPPHAHDDLAIEVATLKQFIQTWEPGHRPAPYSPDDG